MSKEIESLNQMGWNKRPWARLHTTRSRRWLKTTLILTVIFGGFHLLSTIHMHRTALLDKFSPTTYPQLTPEDEMQLVSTRWKWEHLSTRDSNTDFYSRQDVWEHRNEWKRLGSGSEGETFIYNSTVIKVYHNTRFPFRNCVPGISPDIRWPSEISASILLGGLAKSDSIDENIEFLPVTDYFLSPQILEGPPAWHFLTPLLPSGNLVKLAKHLRKSNNAYTPRELDTIFRSSLERLLDTLERMHTKHGLCHDDVKPDNIFLASPRSLTEIGDGLHETQHWILADLGNVREPSHPYHSSILWSSLNDNLPDCRANDVLRLLKSYVLFLRNAMDDAAAFDAMFLEGCEPWSRLFWKTWDDIQEREPVSARHVKTRSTHIHPTSNEPQHCVTIRRKLSGLNAFYRLFLSPGYFAARAVEKTLKISASDQVARSWGLALYLGVPVGKC